MLRTKKLIQFMTILVLALAACNLPSEPKPTPDLPATFTRVAQTRTAEALFTSTSTATPTSTLTPIPPPTPLCDAVEFVQDVTLPDDAILKPGTNSTKMWRLKNSGACTWTTAYAVIFDHGDKLGAQDSYPLRGNVPPGEVVDIEIPITAPEVSGSYQGYWLLRNPAGQKFGLNGAVDRPFWVKIKATDVVYDFVENACRAEWVGSSARGGAQLDCPGRETDSQGFVLVFASKSPRLEDGTEPDFPSLITHPQWNDNGIISGTFPFIQIETGYHFHAQLGCRYKEVGSNCAIQFELNYLTAGGQAGNLGEYDHRYTGTLQAIDIDLSALAGQKVQLVLTVSANGPSDEDFAVWVAPHIAP